MEKARLKIAVRRLVEETLLHGDLILDQWDPVFSVEAIRAHQEVQTSRPQEYSAEVPVSYTVECEKFVLKVAGRIDGVFHYGNWAIVEEIKTTRRGPDEIQAAEKELHWGQARVYSYLYLVTKELERVETRLTYVQLDQGTLLEDQRSYSREELESYFLELSRRHLEEQRRLAEWREVRNRSLVQLGFPYEHYRPGQRALAIQVYRAIRDGRQMLAQAPTGTGKTMAALFPALKSMGQGLSDRVVFLTARTTGQIVCEDAVGKLREHGLRLRSLQLTAKDKICFNPERACNGEDCLFARDYYGRVREALIELTEAERMSRAEIDDCARRHRVCPFELSLDATRLADCVIGDYNYAFDPRVSLRRLFAETHSPTFLVDEAHNLVDRSREMFSAVLEKAHVLELRRMARKRRMALAKPLSRINTWMVRARQQCLGNGGNLHEESPPAELIGHLKKFAMIAQKAILSSSRVDREFREALIKLIGRVGRFLSVAEVLDDRYVTCFQCLRENLQIKLYCLDPSPDLKQQLNRCRSAIFLSATLSPGHYFEQVLGCSDDIERVVLPSPFPRGNLGVFILNGVSTLYRRREETGGEVAKALHVFTGQRLGNYLCFFPSYEYMTQIHGLLEGKLAGARLLIQRPGMEEDERLAFLEAFTTAPEQTLVGFAVLGGIFGEAIDLVGDRLAGAAIVGVGLPGVCTERELIRAYHEKLGREGFDFAYRYPGIHRVLQAAGRVIRSEEDLGAVLLIDERFRQVRYRRLLPPEWSLLEVRNVSQLDRALNRFWGGSEKCRNRPVESEQWQF